MNSAIHMTVRSDTEECPLFIPLKGEYFDAFARGEKRQEFRPWGKRWNERTCRIGRRVVLSRAATAGRIV